MPKKTPENDADLLPKAEGLYLLAEDLTSKLEGRGLLSLTSEQIKEMQRNLLLTARDATQAACSLYTSIKIAESQEKLSG